MGFFRFFRIIKKLIYNKKFLIFFILCFLFMLFINKSFAVDDVYVTNIVYGDDLYNEIVGDQRSRQDQFIFLCLFPYLGNTEAWVEDLKPIFDYMHEHNTAVYISVNVIRDNGVIVGTRYGITLYYATDISRTSNTYTSRITNETFNITHVNVNEHITYNVSYYFNDNSFSVTSSTSTSIQFPYVLHNFRSDNMFNFINTIYGIDNNGILNVISSYLDSIESVNSDILDELVTITSSLTSLPSQFPNNTQQISSINNKVSDLLTDNDTIISQNEEMIDQAEQINDNIQDTTEAINQLNDTITDSSINTSSTDLPTISINDPTENGLNNIFQSMYNAFCVGNPQDIVFPFPYTDKQIVIPVNYLKSNLENSGSSWIVTFIQTFWGYLFGCYIVIDITEKINKIKEGNIEDIEKSNIREDML